MSGRRQRGNSEVSQTAAKKTKRTVSLPTFRKWQRELNKEYDSVVWLKCEQDGATGTVVAMFCEVCRKYEDKIQSLRNYSPVWIHGSTNLKTSSVTDHAKSDQHRAAMERLRGEWFKTKPSSAPIVHSFIAMDQRDVSKMCLKFELCYVLAKEGVAFVKYPVFHSLAERQGVDIGSTYKTPDSARLFTHYIAESQRQIFLSSISSTPFFSFLVDGSTDSANIEQELVFVLYSFKDDIAKEIRSCTRYLSVVSPTSSDTLGLVACLGKAFDAQLGISLEDKGSVLGTECRPVLVGGASDGASVNIGIHSSLKAHLQSKYPWLFWAWCFSHRLELACKDAFTSSLFTDINEMLLRLYYVYHQSPKKSRELSAIANELKEVFHMPKGGRLPVRCHGSRWISHKRNALQRILDGYGGYVTHLAALAEDGSVKAADRAKISGFLRKWSRGRMIIGCAMYIEILKPASYLSLCLQKDSLDIIYCVKHILKSASSLESLSKKDPKEWPMVKLLLSRMTTEEEDGETTYQGGTVTHYDSTTIASCSVQAIADLKNLTGKLRDRLSWSDMELLRAMLMFLDTASWIPKRHSVSLEQASEDDKDDKEGIREAAELISSTFREPLESKGACLASLFDEIDEIVDYARKYLDLLEDYRKAWYKLHSVPEAVGWPNILLLSHLLFSLPFTNSAVERAFSKLKVLKTDRRSRLLTGTLDDLLQINIEGPSPENFQANDAVRLWREDRSRRPHQEPRKQYQQRSSASVTSDTEEESNEERAVEEFTLDDWDRLFEGDDEESDVDDSD